MKNRGCWQRRHERRKGRCWQRRHERRKGRQRRCEGINGTKGDGTVFDEKKVSPEIKQALEKRAIEAKHEAKRVTVDDLLQSKASYRDVPSGCPRVTGVDEEQLGKYKQEYCGVHKHVDLNTRQKGCRKHCHGVC